MVQDYEAIAARLKKYRQKIGKTQDEMGQIIGIGQYYGNIERCQEYPSDLVFVKISEMLNINYDWLLTGQGDIPDVMIHAPGHEQKGELIQKKDDQPVDKKATKVINLNAAPERPACIQLLEFINLNQLKEIGFYLSGLNQGRGDLLPLGDHHLSNLWQAIKIIDEIKGTE